VDFPLALAQSLWRVCWIQLWLIAAQLAAREQLREQRWLGRCWCNAGWVWVGVGVAGVLFAGGGVAGAGGAFTAPEGMTTTGGAWFVACPIRPFFGPKPRAGRPAPEFGCTDGNELAQITATQTRATTWEFA